MIRKLFQTKKFFYRILLVVMILSFVSALLTYQFEHEVNENYDQWSEVLFWWVASLTTVGAGGNLVTAEGQIFGLFTMVFGSFMYLAIFSEIIIWLKNLSDQRFTGIKEYEGSGHIVIAGYNNLTVGLMNFLAKVTKPEIDIVLVTSLIDSNPNPDRLKFIKLNPLTTGTLDKASIAKAKLAFVMSTDDVSDQKSDLNALLIGGMIEEIQGNVFTLAEISDERNSNEMQKFKIDGGFTFIELLEDTKSDPRSSILLKKLPKDIRTEILKEEFLQSKMAKVVGALK